jgi:hypothetical protein
MALSCGQLELGMWIRPRFTDPVAATDDARNKIETLTFMVATLNRQNKLEQVGKMIQNQ